MSRRYQSYPDALRTCREALRQGHLTQDGNHWTFGKRKFHPATVRKLIEYGEAVKVGNHVVAWSPQS